MHQETQELSSEHQTLIEIKEENNLSYELHINIY